MIKFLLTTCLRDDCDGPDAARREPILINVAHVVAATPVADKPHQTKILLRTFDDVVIIEFPFRELEARLNMEGY
jgi:hypothetical protein